MVQIKTTHVGSLPRTQHVVDFIFARENGDAYDEAAFDTAMRDAASETVEVIDATWERVKATDPVSADEIPTRFGRVWIGLE